MRVLVYFFLLQNELSRETKSSSQDSIRDNNRASKQARIQTFPVAVDRVGFVNRIVFE